MHYHSLYLLCYISLLRYAFAQFECSSSTRCKIGCCSNSGFCGFGPSFCGEGNCTSNCDAQAECGQYAPADKQTCPLNVCCSQYGFCGTTSEFCGTGCQNGCEQVQRPSCGASSTSSKRTIGYYESWASERGCDKWLPEDIDPFAWTHIFYSFALIDSSHKIASMNSYDPDFYRRTTNLKKKNPALKVFIAVGGWDAGGKVFSDTARTSGSRKAFIDSAISLMQSYAFDGIDIDWEYPFAPDRGGAEEDIENFVTLMKELKAACGSRYGVTLTLPSSYWYMQGFDVAGLQDHVDWFQFMSYDIHGTWDGNSPYTKAVVAPHTNLTEISQGLDLLWRNNVKPSKVVLGLGFYGRSFTLTDPSCKTPGCAFSSGAKAGTCTVTSGVLSNAEIQRIIKNKGVEPVLDREAGTKWINWDSDQWVSYDDAETYKMKKDFANNLCLGGTMVWALDQEDKDSRESSKDLTGNDLKFEGELGDANSAFYQNRAAAFHLAQDYGLAMFWTTCQPYDRPRCPVGFKPFAYGHGKVYDADFAHVAADGCHGGGNGYNRVLCGPANLQGQCKWFGSAKSCNKKCDKGWWQISQNSHIGFEKTGCQTGRYARFCCKSLYTFNTDQCYDARVVAANMLSGGLATYDTELVERGQNYFNPQPCGSEYLQYNLRYENPGWFGAGVEGHFSLVGETAVWEPATSLQNNNPQATDRELRGVTITQTVETSTHTTASTTCDGSRTTQPCHHYSSVARRRPDWSTLRCPQASPAGVRQAPRSWDEQHDKAWSVSWIPSRLDCERDEYPFFRFFGPAHGSWIRLLKGSENRAANAIPNRVCPETWTTHTGPLQGGPVNRVGDRYYTTLYRTDTVTVPYLALEFTNCDLPDAGLTANQCNPTTLTSDRGFALLRNDPWYAVNRGHNKFAYADPPLPALTNGKTPVNRRDYLPDEFILDLGNSSRRATEEEVYERHGLVRCHNDDCAEEAQALGLDFTAPPYPEPAKTAQVGSSSVEGPSDTTSKSTQTGSAASNAGDAVHSPSPAMGHAYSIPTSTGSPQPSEGVHNNSNAHLHAHRRRHVHGHGHGHSHVA